MDTEEDLLSEKLHKDGVDNCVTQTPSLVTSTQPGDSESHRIYWQQWLSSNEKSVGTRREWVTSSAAVRISPVARAVDVTGLLRESLQLSPLERPEHDALVLVGTLYSLSRDHVRFEHEKVMDRYNSGKYQEQRQHHQGAPVSGKSSTSSDAFNVMHTLHPNDHPLQVRDQMADHLRKLQHEAVVGRTIISPKLQWYYCPVLQPADNKSLIPSCINLEGYCTSMEEDVDDWGYDNDDDDVDHVEEEYESSAIRDENDSLDMTGGVEDMDLLASRFPWLCTAGDDTEATRQSADAGSRYGHLKRKFRQENRRLNILAAHEASLPQGTLSGYLLKRSSKDAHVWRRVHCVLTDDYLWFVSRRYTHYHLTFAKHGRVRLTRALLLEPSVDYAPLYRTPYAFEMVAADGTSHVFRAANRAVQCQWIKSISDRIIQSYENSLLESAQLIVNDECVAHARRIDGAMDKLWECIQQQQKEPIEKDGLLITTATTLGGSVGSVMRWTLKVTDFRHFCRHVRSSLPPKSPVVVISPHNSRKLPPPPPSALTVRDASGEHARLLDPFVKSMIRSAWQQATALLQEATELGQTLQTDVRPHRNLETLLRHVEFVLTGRQRSVRVPSGSSTVSGNDEAPYHDRGEPPPVDLFDTLENELQVIAVSIQKS